VFLAIHGDGVLAPAIQHFATAVRFETAAGPEVRTRFGLARNLGGLRYAAMTRHAIPTAGRRRRTASAFQNAAAAVCDRSTLTGLASLLAVLAVIGVDPPAARVASRIERGAFRAAATRGPILEVIARGRDLRGAGTRDDKPGNQNERGAFET